MSRKLILTITLAIVVGMTAGTALADLLAYYPFDEGQGTDVTDATGNGNDGTINGSVEWVPGVRGTALRFDATGERVVLNEIDPTADNNAMTLAAWINWEGEDHATITHHGIFGKRQGWDPRTNVKWFWEAQPDGDLAFRNGDGSVTASGVLDDYSNEWVHVAVTWDNAAVVQYINAEEVSTGTSAFRDTADATVVSIGCVSATNNEVFIGSIDEAYIYSHVLAPAELQKIMTGDFTSSSGPVPPDTSDDIPQDVIISWTPGDYAGSHDVYFGASLADVEAAERSNPLGVLVSQGQTDLTYDPPGLLEFSQTYYWRIDEVNAPPDNTIFKGAVWSFTVEPFVYPVPNVIATASHADATSGPENTINGSGLNADDEHSIDAPDMWLASPGPDEAVWIQYEFDEVYKLHEMWVWNYNVMFELVLGFGLKDVTIEYSTDGAEWITLGDVEFAKAPATTGYAHNTTVDLSGVSAKYVRINVNSGHGPMGQFGLSEVRFYYKPVQAREPQPPSGQDDVALDTMLSWRSGREVAVHEVYFSTDRDAVADGTALADTLDASRYQPDALDYGTTYYWKVNEVNEAATPTSWEGQIWSFSTLEFLVVDDFESYDDDENRIFDTWLDGFINETGSTVGYFDAPFAEQNTVNSGSQSMPLEYINDAAPFYSEAEYDLGSANWTLSGADTLKIHVAGKAPAFLEAADGSILMSAIGNDIWGTADQFRYAYKTLTGDGSITARVDALDGTPNSWAKGGVMIRQNVEPGAINTFMAMTGGDGGGATYQQRLEADTDSVSQHTYADGPFAPPYWVRVTREGNTLQGFTSPDGENWTQRGDVVTLVMAEPVLIGLATTSHNTNQATGAAYSNITTTGNVSAGWEMAEIGVAQPTEGNDPEPLYVAIEDTSGNVAVVTHPDASITARSGWTEWVIPFSELNGVNLSRAAIMYIGVGDRDNPTAGGTGLIFIDDILVGHPGSSDPGASGLVASYSLNNDTADASGNGRDGAAVGDPVYVDGPAGGMALLFDGVGGQYVDLGAWNPSAATGQLTVSIWANWNGLSGQYQGLIAKRDVWAADDMMWQIEANRDNGTLGFFRNGSAPPDGDPVLPIGEWAHVAATFDGTIRKFYFNAEMTGEGPFSFGSDTEAALVFGACQGDGGNPFNGALADVRLYDRALSAFEISYLAGK